MKPSELTTFLTAAIARRHPILITGSPGIGKTSIVEQAAIAAGNDLVVSHPAVADPTDAKGFPWVKAGAKVAEFLPFGETAKVLHSKRPTTWFLDDLGQAPPSVQASYMPWLLARQVNGHRLPDHVTIIAATNRRTDRAGVSGVLEPVKSRFTAIVELVPSVDEWCQWALGRNDIPPELVGFIRFRPEKLNAFIPSADLVNCPIPRTWHAAGQILTMQLPAGVESEAIAGAIGEATAAELLAFIRLFRQLPNIDAILMNPDSAPIPTQISVLHAVTAALAVRANETNFARVTTYANRLVQAGHGEFATCMVRDAVQRNPDLATTQAFVRLMSSDLGGLISGATLSSLSSRATARV